MANPQQTSPSVNYVQLETDLSTVGDPPAGYVFMGRDSGGDPAGKLPDGTIITMGSGSGGAPTDADYLTTTSDGTLTSETVVNAHPFTTGDIADGNWHFI